MNMENVRQVLEEAAQIFLSAANTITSEKRREAEKVFLQFRRSQFSLDLYRYLIENSSSSYVVYQTLTAFREGIVKEWSSLDDTLKEQVVQYLLSYVYTHYSTLSVHVREQALQILVVINKRRKAQRAQIGKHGFTVSIALINLLQSTNEKEFQFGLLLLNAFINEYSFSNGNEAGLTFEERHTIKLDFESNELKTVFELLLNKLHNSIPSLQTSDYNLFCSILTSIEKILSWNFSLSSPNARRYMQSPANVETIDWRPLISWKQLVLDQQLVEFFFHIYVTLKSLPEIGIVLELRCQILRCLSQLACLNGPLVTDEQCRLRYLTTFSYYFVQTFLINSKLTINTVECFDLANIVSNLITLFTVKGFCSMNNDLCNSFLQLMSQITTFLGRTMTVTSSNNQLHQIIEDPTISKETFDRILQAWSRLLYGIDFGRFSNLRPLAIEIFDMYLQTHLHINENNVSDSMDDNNDEDDRDLFSEQLICIGLFGRHIIDYALPLLIRLLIDRTKKLYDMMNNVTKNINTNDLDRINDDLHWLLLICGYVLTEDYDAGEQKTIPEAVMNFSSAQVKYCDLKKCVQIAQHILQQPELDLNEQTMQGVSPVTQCVVAILKLSEIERRLCNKGLFDYISVQVAVSLTWIIRRLAANYLGFDEQSYQDVSQTLSLLLGKGSDMLEFLTNYFLSKVFSNLQVWASESDVVKETADLFVALSIKKESSSIIIKNDLFWTIANNVISNQMPIQIINEEHKRLLIKGITCSCLSNSSDEYRLLFNQSVFEILNQRLNSIVESISTLIEQVKLNNENKVHCTNALQTFFSESVLSQVNTLINSYCGLVEGGSRCSSTQIAYLFEHSQQTLKNVLELFDFYHNYSDQVQNILELFCLYAEHVLVYLNANHTNLFYTYVLRLLQIFSKCNYGKKSREINADEDFNGHIYALLNCLIHLLAKDFIDFSNDNVGNIEINVGDVVLYGLTICLPLIQSDNLLKIPSISLSYYKIVSSLCEQHADCVFRLLNQEQYSTFLSTIKLGLDNYDNEICKMCLETIQSLTLFKIKHDQTNSNNEKTKYLEHFLDYLLQEIVTTTTTFSDLFDTLAGTIYTLICAYPNQLFNYLGQLKQQDENFVKLIDKFVHNIGQTFDYNRKSKVSFTSHFESFVVELKRIMKNIFFTSSKVSTFNESMAWRSSGSTHRELIENLYKNGLIKDQRIKDAMLKVDRADFTDHKSDAYEDRPQSIGYAVTISAPHMHCFGLEILKDQLKPGAKVLDVGSGSGYLTACMAYLVQPGGKAVGVDHIQELVDKAIINIRKSHKDLFEKGLIEIHKADGRQGFASEAPFDAIHVGAAASDTPHELIRQLKVGGRLVSPVGSSFGQEMITYDKKADGSYEKQTHMGVMYVPLTDESKQYASAGIRKDL